MEPTGCTFLLLLLVLIGPLGRAWAAGSAGTQDDASSLCYIFHVSASGPSWCEFVGMMNGNQFFTYSCKTAKSIGPLEMMLNAIEARNPRCGHWKDLVEELRKALLDNKENISKAFHSLSLRVHMMCQQESDGCHSAFCQFDINEQRCLRLDLKNRSWTELHPGCRSLKETLDSDRQVTNLLVLVSNGDCVKLLNQSTVLDTKAAPATATTTVPAPSKAMNISSTVACIFPISFFLLSFLSS